MLYWTTQLQTLIMLFTTPKRRLQFVLLAAIIATAYIGTQNTWADNANKTLQIELQQEHIGGSIQVLLFDDAESFEDFSSPARMERFPADGRQTITLDDIPAGEYALLVFHDENDNMQLDVNFIGIPSEPIGFSNEYRPRGAPTFRNARFDFEPGETDPIQMDLQRPLGDRGSIGVGAVVITRGSPYARTRDNPLNVFPAVVYLGNRLQILGPSLQLGLIGTGRRRLAGTIAYRQATFEADDSPVLDGMRNRRATAMAGLRAQTSLVYGINLAAEYNIDMLNRIGGAEGRISLSRSFPWERFRFNPSLTLNYIQPRLTRHDYGITPAEATDERPAYRPGTAWNPEVGFSIFAEITPNIMGSIISSVEWFDSSIRRSPIVDDHYVIKATSFVVYMF